MYTILKLYKEHTKKTHVPVRACLDEEQLEKYLDFLTGLGFLTTHDGECGTTEKGRLFISARFKNVS
jgi:predicted transcriptional regulator